MFIHVTSNSVLDSMGCCYHILPMPFPVMEPNPHFLYHKQHYSKHSNTCPFMGLCRKCFGGNSMKDEVVRLPDFPASPWPSLVWTICVPNISEPR